MVLDSNLKQRIINVNRKSDRLIVVKLAMPMPFQCRYAPQTDCPDQEKQEFRDDFDNLLDSISLGELKYIVGDLN